MAATSTDPTAGGRLARWPAAVVEELARRAGPVRSAARGRVLDLDDPAARALVTATVRTIAGDDRDDRDGGGGYDTIVSIAALIEFADLPAAVRGIRLLLAPGGRFEFVEPMLRPGWRGLVGASAGALLPAVRGRHVGRDIALAVRSNGFIITDIERFAMPTSIWPLRAFAQGRALVDPGLLR